MYDARFINDGDPAFGVEGTFQIHDTIFVKNHESLYLLETMLGVHEYVLNKPLPTNGGYEYFMAKKRHKQTHDEGLNETLSRGGHATAQPLSLIVSMKYLDKPAFPLSAPDIHDRIISEASQRRDIGYYNRPTDHFNAVALTRMTGFVHNMVDVPKDKWQAFLMEYQYDHAQDFIRGMAHWAGTQSDMSERKVRIDMNSSEIIDPEKPFIHKHPKNRGLYYIP